MNLDHFFTLLLSAGVAASLLVTLLLARGARKALWQLNSQLRDLKRAQQTHSRELAGTLGSRIEDAALATQNAVALDRLGHGFPIFLGEASIDGFHAKALVQRLVEHRPRVIVELGSGSTTVLIAQTLKALGLDDVFHLSVDHDARYLELSRRWAGLAGLADRVKFLHAPLAPCEHSATPWYSGVAAALGGRKVDFLLVDGPPAYQSGLELARYPALPALHHCLAEHCTVILDDANRPGERSGIERWRAEFPEFLAETVRQGKGTAILTRQPPPAAALFEDAGTRAA